MRPLLVVLVCLSLGAAATAQVPNDPTALAAKVQQRYNAIKDFQGDFVQTYEGGVLRTKTTERGTVAIKRPGRMRFVYSKPERKEFVSDGTRLFTYLVADKQVIVSPAPIHRTAACQPSFWPAVDLARDYVATFTPLPGAAAGLITLKLVPRKPHDDYDSLGIGIDPNSLQIQFLTALDKQGGRSSFTFSNLKENRGLADKDFEFRIPRGVDVVTNGARAQ